MKVITPVFLDIFLFYCYLNTEYQIKGSRIRAGGCIILLTCISSLIVNSMPEMPFVQLFVYLLIMPFVVALFYGNIWIKVAAYLKFLLALTVIDLLSVYILNRLEDVQNKNYTFIVFMFFTITVRLLAYLFLKKRGKQKKINYFKITSYRYILIKAITALLLLTGNSYIMLNEEILHREILWDMRIILLVILVVLTVSIF